MTKELNLSVNDTSEITTDKTASSQKSTPKEGKSLFDNLLSNISEKDTSAEKTNQTDTSKKTVLTSDAKKDISSNAVKSTLINNTPESKTQKEQTANTANQIKSETSVGPVKVENKTLSLMDRMLLESAQKVTLPTQDELTMVKNQTPKVLDNVVSNKTNETTDLLGKTEKKTDENTKTDIKTVGDKKSEISKKEPINTDDVENMKNSNSKSLLDMLLKDISTQIKDVTPPTIENTSEKIDKSDSVKGSETKTSDPLISKLQTLITEESPLKTEIAHSEKNIQTAEKTSPISLSETKLNVLPKIDINNTTKESELIKTVETKPVETILSKEVQKSEPNLHKNNSEVTQLKMESTVVKENTEVISNELKTVKPEKSLMDQLLEESKTSIKNNNDKVVEAKISTEKNIDTKGMIKDTVSSETKVSEPTIVKNEKVASELAKIQSSQVESNVNISKDDIKKLDEANKPEKTEVPKAEKPERSLLDKLVEESKDLLKNKTQETKVEVGKASETNIKQQSEKNINPLMTNIYLSSQKSTLNEAAIVKVSTGKNMAAQATNVKDVEKSANFLNLGLQDSEVTVKVQEFEKHSKLNILDKLAFAKSVINQDLTKNSSDIISKQTVSVSNNAAVTSSSTNEIETTVQLNVSAQAATTIESKIIGARQQMGTMMSDVARSMYLNYKPPVTAFKINLMPGTLGSIAIIMKSDKDSGLSISLNMSNSSTLDSMVDNQGALRAALAKNFSTENSFSLDFNMQNQNNDGGNSNNENRDFNQQSGSNTDESTLTNNEQGISQENVNSNYM